MKISTGKGTSYQVGYLVAEHFVDNPNNYKTIRYLDNNHQNCKYTNIIWTSVDDPFYQQVPNLEGEVWKDIQDYEGLYQVSNFGRIKSLPITYNYRGEKYPRIFESKIMNPTFGSDGYASTQLTKNKIQKTFRVHRIVAETFIPNPDNLPIVDHINRIRNDNKASNLRWVTPMDNAKNGLTDSVIATYKDGTTKKFDSLKEASSETGLSSSSISSRCNSGKGAKSKDGITFIWADEHTKRSKLAKKNKNKGNTLELEIINKLKEIGYDGCVSSRSQDKRADSNKIDIIDLNNELPINIQSKYLTNTPNYFAIRDACTDKSKPFVVVWKKTGTDGKNSPGTIGMVPLDFLLDLLELYKKSKN